MRRNFAILLGIVLLGIVAAAVVAVPPIGVAWLAMWLFGEQAVAIVAVAVVLTTIGEVAALLWLVGIKL